MSGLTRQPRDETCAERKSQRGLWLGVNAFAAYDLDRPIAFDHLICDGINADGGYVLASGVSVDFPESDLLQFFHRYQHHVHTGFSRHRRSTAGGHGVLV